MPDYKTIDKTGWFIQQMRSGLLSRQQIVAIAAKEFPSIPVKTLDGTIGQYWSDCVNPKWGTYKAIQARGLKGCGARWQTSHCGGQRNIHPACRERQEFNPQGDPGLSEDHR
jgi:hypothetical protein